MIKKAASFLKTHVALKISLIYAGFSALWILLSDQFLYLFVKDPQIMTKIQMVKGWVFIFVTSLIIFYLLYREIAKYERTERALRESEKKYRDLVNNSPDVLYRTDTEGRIVYISPQVEEAAGYTAQEVLGKKMADQFYVYPEQRNELLETLRLKGKARNFTALLKRKDGSTYWASSNAHFQKDLNGRTIGVEGVTRDVTEQKKAEKLLTQREEKLRDLLENITNMFYSHTPDHVLTYVSPQVEDLLGYTPEEAMVKWTELLSDHPLNRIGFEKTVRAIETGERQPPYELELVRKTGEKIMVEVREAPKVKDGKTIAIVGTLLDITDRKRAEKEKLEAQRAAAEQEKLVLVGRIAGKMAHDFNNVLGVIMGNTELALLDCTDDEVRKTLELVYEQSLRGKNLTKNLVAFAKNQEPRQEFFRINETVDLVVSLLKKDLKGIEVVKEAGSGVPDLFADPGMIEHALINLLQNSIHAVGRTRNPRIVIRTYCCDSWICLDIEDNGCGIPQEYLNTIYEPSFTLKGGRDTTGAYRSEIKGTGYGMANVKKYIDQHKGEISVESELNKGTRFTIRLPVVEKELTPTEIKEVERQNVQSGRYILLVEDEPAVSDVQYRILTQAPCSHKVDVASNGKMALDLLQRNTYDLVSLDYVLFGNVTGMDVYAHIRETNTDIPVLFISGNIEFLESIRDLKRKDSNVDHLSKPCPNKEYVNRINGLLERALSVPK